MQGGVVHADQRPGASRRTPGNKLSETERLRILDVCNSPEFASLSPNIIVPTLADRGVYIASESTFYRVLKSATLSLDRLIVQPRLLRPPRFREG